MRLFKAFGASPDRKRRNLYQRLPNYRNGRFQNPIPTPALTEGYTFRGVLWDQLKKFPQTVPPAPIPHSYTDLHHLNATENALVWFGHSSYFMQTEGKKILVDPVFSGSASPLPHSIRAFPGSDVYHVSDMPDIDWLFITHDHWDHLDYQTIEGLKGRVGMIVCGLGVGRHFEYWGWPKEKIAEHNWGDKMEMEDGFEIRYTPARHFSGRSFRRNISLWTSFILETPKRRLFLGGDSGYGPHFKTIGEKYGPFDVAILECGQYNVKWAYIHSQPEQTLQEAIELKAKFLLPVHHSKFRLAQHPWMEPLEKITAAAQKQSFPVLTPMIGEKVDLDHLESCHYDHWWINS